MPVASPIAQRPSPSDSRASTGEPARARLQPDGLEPEPGEARRAGRSRPAAGRRAAPSRPRARARSPHPRGAPPLTFWPRRSSIPSAASASPIASPSGARLAREQVLGALHDRHRGAHARERLGHLDADGAAAEHEQPARHLGEAGRLAVGPHAVELAQPRDRRDHRVRAGGDDDVLGGVACRSPTTTRPGPARRPSPRRTSIPAPSRPGRLAGVVVARDHEVAVGERRRGVDRVRSRPPRRRRRRARRRPPRPAAAASWTGCTPSRSIRRRAARAPRSRPAGRRRRARRRSAPPPARRR